jgi:hypothetical protein
MHGRNLQFPKDEAQMDKNYIKTCLAYLPTREMQIQTILRISSEWLSSRKHKQQQMLARMQQK